jgi:hypothetical protein
MPTLCVLRNLALFPGRACRRSRHTLRDTSLHAPSAEVTRNVQWQCT